MRILITDSDARSALAATRSLGRRGHTVFTSGEREPSLASVSKYSAGFDTYSSPYRSPRQHVTDVAAILEKRKIDVLLPMTEITTLLLTEHQATFPDRVRLPFAAAHVVAAAADKSQVLTLAREIGVPIPNTEIVRSADEANALTKTLTYPVVVKAARSRVWTGDQWLSTSVAYCNTPEELITRLSSMHPAIFPVLLQERIEGPGVGVFICCDEDNVIATFSHRRIREKPPSGGVSVLSESVAVDPVALGHATRLLKELKWRGVAMVEFKQDNRDGSLKLMEINGRFWGSLQLAIDAGVDFPSLLVDLAQGIHAAQPPQYRIGVRTRWLWGDVDAMLSLLTRNRARLNLPPSHPGKWATLGQFMQFWRSGTRYELERRDDLRPWLLATKRWFRNQQ